MPRHSETEFDKIVAEMIQPKHQCDDIETVTGRHEDHGAVILIRDATRCMALVDEPAFLDKMQAQGSASAARAAVGRARRAGKDC